MAVSLYTGESIVGRMCVCVCGGGGGREGRGSAEVAIIIAEVVCQNCCLYTSCFLSERVKLTDYPFAVLMKNLTAMFSFRCIVVDVFVYMCVLN